MISIAAILALFLLWVPFSATAADVTLVPSLGIRGEYDDNVGFQRIEERDDYLATISPSFVFNYGTELLNLNSGVAVDLLRYKDETNLNTENQRWELDGAYKILERLQIKGDFSYIKDTTLESELEETGLVIVRADRKRYNTGGGLSYQMTEVSDVGVDYTHRKTDYDWPGYVDYDYDVFSFSFNSRLRNSLDIFTVQPYYSYTDSRTSKVDTYAVLVGWSHRFTETLDLTAFAGPRHTRIEYIQITPEVEERDAEWGYVVDCAVRKLGETYSTSLGYDRNIVHSAYGEPIERDRVYCSAHKWITRRFRVLFSGGLYFTKSEGKFYVEDSRYFYVAPALDYKISEDHTLQFAYRYAHVYDKEVSRDPEYDRSRIWIALNLRFPVKGEK